MSALILIEDLVTRVARQPRLVLGSPDVCIHLNAGDFRLVQDWMIEKHGAWAARLRGLQVLLRDVADGGVIVGEEKP